MSDKRPTHLRSRARRKRRAAALVPLAVLSGSWTASLAMSDKDSTTAKAAGLSQGISVPAEAIKVPASVSTPGRIAASVPSRRAGGIVNASSTHGIPAAALAAYQRAAQVINASDSHCNLDWPLVAAIGRVESDHGRYDGSSLSLDGVSRPGIFGIPLDGSHGTQRIKDTDAGLYDKDRVYDRAVGPMQFIPTTWAVVGVDADGDARRNPQDIDDAALAAAVYLCSGPEDLSKDRGQAAAVFRYNHSQAYVRLVQSIARRYAAGEFAATPTSAYASVQLVAAHNGSQVPSGRGPSPTNDKTVPTSNTQGQTASQGGQPTAVPPEPDKTDAPTPNVISGTISALDKATAYCRTQLGAVDLALTGGLKACASLFLSGGSGAVLRSVSAASNLVAGLLGRWPVN